MTLLHLLKKNSSDNLQTPPIALKPLLPFIKKDWVIWEPACGKGNLVNELKRKGYKTIGTDILKGQDFFKINPEKWDCLITNPPYSIKDEWIERCFYFDKPFALLLPITALETGRRQKQWEKGLQLMLFNKRINFELEKKNKKSNCWFATAWFTYKLNLPKDLFFTKL